MIPAKTVHFTIDAGIIPILESRLAELVQHIDEAWDAMVNANETWQQACDDLNECRAALYYWRRHFAKARQNALLDTPITSQPFMRAQYRLAFWRQSQQYWRNLAVKAEAANSDRVEIYLNNVASARQMIRWERQIRRRLWQQIKMRAQ